MNQLASKYAGQLKAAMEAAIGKFSSTGALQGSVRVSVINAQGDQPPVIRAEFFQYGEYIGKRKLLWVKLPPIDKIREFVEKRGLTTGGRVPGYKNGAPNLPDFKKAERIAWAIALDKRKNDTHRPKRWKRQALPDVLRALNEEVLREFAKETAEILATSISNQ